MVATRNQSLTEAKGSEVVNPTNNIRSVPSTTPTSSGARW